MTQSISLCLVILASFSSQTAAQDLYRTTDCAGYKNPDADASPEMQQAVSAAFPKRSVAAGMIINIGRNNALKDMRRHRENQCQKRQAGRAFDESCPIGKTIIVDDYVADALAKFADQNNGALQKIVDQQIKDARVEARAMMSTCNDR